MRIGPDCHKCGAPASVVDDYDDAWCASCLDNAAEAAWERQQQRDLESPPESAREEQLRTWNEHQQLHKR